MAEFIEIDFIQVGQKGSGDAIAIRRRHNGRDTIYVIDGGYAEDGQKLVDHIRQFYGKDYYINHLVLTHPDSDHASGLVTVMEKMRVICLWMNRPWRHVYQLMPSFEHYQDRDRLIARLRHDFPKVAELEKLASSKGIFVRDAFRGDTIGEFTVLSPSKDTYCQLVVASKKTPVPAAKWIALRTESISNAAWGEENLKGDAEGTTPENETSIVQYAEVCGKTTLLTGDAGVRALTEAHRAACEMGKSPGSLDWFQVPHHGSRRNISTCVLDTWLGPKLPETQVPTEGKLAIISANPNDTEHPKKAVVRAMIHRGRRVFQPRGILCTQSGNALPRNWAHATPLEYPREQED